MNPISMVKFLGWTLIVVSAVAGVAAWRVDTLNRRIADDRLAMDALVAEVNTLREAKHACTRELSKLYSDCQEKRDNCKLELDSALARIVRCGCGQ